jgi:hypothetical protein
MIWEQGITRVPDLAAKILAGVGFGRFLERPIKPRDPKASGGVIGKRAPEHSRAMRLH